MGYVIQTITSSINDAYTSESLHFEDFEDFVAYHEPPTPVSFEGHLENNIFLTEDQAYKLRIILGHVLGDKDCCDISAQLEGVFGGEIFVEDYDKMYFSLVVDGERLPLDDTEAETAIQFKQEN